jgi:hypothetical protein
MPSSDSLRQDQIMDVYHIWFFLSSICFSWKMMSIVNMFVHPHAHVHIVHSYYAWALHKHKNKSMSMPKGSKFAKIITSLVF